MKLGPGTKVTPNVQLVRLLGEGGMGSVWVADHLTLDTQVAVKFIHAELAGRDESLQQRFKREASIAARLTSPHVVKVFDHGLTDDGVPYIVMELLAGESLAESLERRGRLGLEEVRVVLSQLAGLLGNAHDLGIVHRDIKPDNLFLLESEYDTFVKVLDFGIAKRSQVEDLSVVTATGAMVGTPFFMSPEQLLQEAKVDHRCDLWAAAVVTYNALTGRLPFKGTSLAALSMAICRDEFTPPSKVAATVPAALDPWFERALAKDPAERFASADELAKAFSEAVEAAPGVEDEDTAEASSEECQADSMALADTCTPAEQGFPDPKRGDDDGDVAHAATVESGAGIAPAPADSATGGPLGARRLGLAALATVFVVGGIVVARSWGNDEGAGLGMAADGTASAGSVAEVPSDPSAASAEPLVQTTASVAEGINDGEPADARSAASAGSASAVVAKTGAGPTHSSPVKNPPVAPPSKSVQPGEQQGPPSYCNGVDGFDIDEKGHKVPKPECLK
jgi:hypothetical protein